MIELPLNWKLAQKTANHTFQAQGRILKTDTSKGFMVSISVTKVESGDPVKILAAKAERSEAKAAADKAAAHKAMIAEQAAIEKAAEETAEEEPTEENTLPEEPEGT